MILLNAVYGVWVHHYFHTLRALRLCAGRIARVVHTLPHLVPLKQLNHWTTGAQQSSAYTPVCSHHDHSALFTRLQRLS
jgi:hypothetical protein